MECEEMPEGNNRKCGFCQEIVKEDEGDIREPDGESTFLCFGCIERAELLSF